MALLMGAAMLLTTPWVAAGQAYLGLGTSVVYSANEHFEETPVLLDYDLGFGSGALALGYAFDGGFRTELEAAYWSNELEIIEFDDARGIINTSLPDSVDTTSVLLNAIYDFDLGIPLHPYIGVGLGMANVDYQLSVTGTGEVLLDDNDTAFAYQAILGAGVSIGRRFHLGIDYRYWRNANVNMRTQSGEPVKTDHPIHKASVTLSYAFAGARSDRTAHPRPSTGAAPFGTGWYNELRFGSIGAEDSDIEDGQVDTNFDAFDIGTAVSYAVGYTWQRGNGRGWRAELEASRWQNHADVIDFGKVRGEFRLSGPIDILGVAGNVIYDFAPRATLRPYLGLGVGFADVDYDVTLHEDGVATQYVDDSDSAITVQALVGLSVRLTQHIDASLNYRYWWAPSITLTDPQQISLKTEHSAHTLMLGLRYRMGGD
jgi:opacity protein-like surface antigen